MYFMGFHWFLTWSFIDRIVIYLSHYQWARRYISNQRKNRLMGMPLAALVCVVIHIPLLIHAPLFVFTNRKGVILFGGGVCTPIQKQSGLFSTVDIFFSFNISI